MELLLGPSKARKVLLLQDCQSEVLVLTSPHLADNWSAVLTDALKSCVRRGLSVKLLLESAAASSRIDELRNAGIQIRQAPKKFSWVLRPFPVHAELWIFDRSEAIAVNNRRSTAVAQANGSPLHMECLLGAEPATGLSGYFDRRWENDAQPLAFSVRHKNYAFHSGRKAELEFFGCLFSAKSEVTICLPGGRVSRKVEQSLHSALRDRLKVTIFTNADRDDAPALRRLRRLSAAGAAVKICGSRLRSECALIDGQSIYVGSLPTSWHRFTGTACPVFVMNDRSMGSELLLALESQVSVEIRGSETPSYAFR